MGNPLKTEHINWYPVGSVRTGRQLGLNNGHQYTYLECPECGIPHWSDKEVSAKCWRCNHKGKSGDKNPMWKGGRFVNKQGYIEVYLSPNSSFVSMAIKTSHCFYILEHRLVMAQHLGRCLKRSEVVHHLNHNKQDNRIENLKIHEIHTHDTITVLENRINILENKLTQQEKLIRLLLWHIQNPIDIQGGVL
jgi:hypothetical protein